MPRRMLALTMLALAAPVLAPAQTTFRHGRVRFVEGSVFLQRALETGAEEAVSNLPFLPGDRVWTDDRGRIEFQFADGSLLRVDRRSKVDYAAHEGEGRPGERIVLRLWSGGLSLHTRNRRGSPDFALEVPGGVVEARERGVYRADLESGETRISVYEGEAVLRSGRRVRIRAGERLYARRGEVDEEPERFDRGETDEFAQWVSEREDRDDDAAWADRRGGDLPEDIAPYAGELESSGAWYYEAEIGHVWRPYVAPGWHPYWNGRWIWTAYGWTWVPGEPWGWAPFHYGRWGWSAYLGWYWIPGGIWGPAWVSWAVGTDSIGWCALDHRDRPLVIFEKRDRGRAVPRGSSAAASPWVFVRHSDIGARDLAQRRLEAGPALLGEARIVESPRARLSRDLKIAETGGAVPRTVRTKPSIGDTVPELRSDPTTVIPLPTPRRRYESEREREDQPRRALAPRQSHGAAEERESRNPATESRPAEEPSPWSGILRERDRPAKADDPDREVLRPLFGPFSQPRSRGEEGRPGGSARSRPESAPREQPRVAPPSHPEPSPRGQGDHAVRRPQREKDQ